MSEEEKRSFSRKHSEILTILENSIDTIFLYLLLLNSHIDAKDNIYINNGILAMLFKLLSEDAEDKKSEFQVLGKYIKTIEDLIKMYKIGRPLMNAFMLDDW